MTVESAAPVSFRVDQTHDVINVRVDVPTRDAHWEQWFLVRSDAHHDSPDCDRRLEQRHLDEALIRGAGIIDLGDLFDAMQAPHDMRRSQAGRNGQSDDYFNDLVDDHVEFYAPYAANWIMAGIGNHETAVIKHCGYNLTREFARRMRADHGSPCIEADYCGWLKFNVTLGQTQRQSVISYWSHGSGGSSPVTKGVLKAGRRGLVYPDAQLFFSGHTHEGWVWPITRTRLTKLGVEFEDEQIHVQIPSYKRRPAVKGAWEKQKEFSPQPHGAWWVKLFVRDKRVQYDVVRAM